MERPKTWRDVLDFVVHRSEDGKARPGDDDPSSYDASSRPRPHVPKSPDLGFANVSIFYRQDDTLLDRLLEGLRDWLRRHDLLDTDLGGLDGWNYILSRKWQSILRPAVFELADVLWYELPDETRKDLPDDHVARGPIVADIPASVADDRLDVFGSHPPGPMNAAVRYLFRLYKDRQQPREWCCAITQYTITFSQHVLVSDHVRGLLVSPPMRFTVSSPGDRSGPVVAALVALSLQSHPDFKVAPPPPDLCRPPSCPDPLSRETALHATLPSKWHSLRDKPGDDEMDDQPVLQLSLSPDPCRLTFRKLGEPFLHRDLLPLSIDVLWIEPASPPSKYEWRHDLRARQVEVDVRKTFLSDDGQACPDVVDDSEGEDDRSRRLPYWARDIARPTQKPRTRSILVDAYLRMRGSSGQAYFTEPVRVAGPYPDPDGRSELVLDDKPIGSGNSGDVWRGHLVSTDHRSGERTTRPVVWKVMDWERIDYFARESLGYETFLAHRPDLAVPKYIGTFAAADCSWMGILLEDAGGRSLDMSRYSFDQQPLPIRKALKKAVKELHDAGACQTSFRPDNVIVIGSPFPAPRPPPAVEVNGNACEGVGRVERSVDESGAVDDGAAKPEADSRHEDLHEALDADHVDSSARTLKQTRATNDDPACAEADETSATPPHELDQNVDGPQCARLVDSARSDPREPGEPCEAETELPHGLDEDVRPLEPLERAPARCSRETESRPVDGKLQHGNECEEVGGGDGEAGGTDEQGGAGKDQSGGEDVEKKGAVNGTGDGHQGATKAHAREGSSEQADEKPDDDEAEDGLGEFFVQIIDFGRFGLGKSSSRCQCVSYVSLHDD